MISPLHSGVLLPAQPSPAEGKKDSGRTLALVFGKEPELGP
jgi:hypothetical protein